MTVNLSCFAGAGWQFFTDTGTPLTGGLVYTYAAGTTTPLTTYTSASGATPNSNPIVLDSAGRPPAEIWLTSGAVYKFVLKDATAVLIRTYDDIPGINDATAVLAGVYADFASTTDNAKGDALVGFKQSGASGFLTGAVARTVNTKLQELISVKDFGAAGTALVDDTAAIQAAINYAGTMATTSPYTGAEIYFPPGQYLVSSTLNISYGNITLRGAGNGRSTLVRNAAYGDTIYIDNTAIIENVTISGLTMYHDISLSRVMSGAHIHAIAPLHFVVENCNLQNGAYGIQMAGGVYVYINNCHLQGQYLSGSPAQNSTVGLYFTPTTNTGAVPVPTIVNVTNTQIAAAWVNVNAAYQYGCVINAAEEVHFTNCTFNSGPITNLYLQQLATNDPILEVTFTTCFFDVSQAYNVWINGSAGNGSNVISRVRFIGCGFNGENVVPPVLPGVGLQVDATNRGGAFPQCLQNLDVIGCTFQAFYNSAMVLSGSDINIQGCTIYDNNQSNAVAGNGITVGAASKRVSISNNNIGNVAPSSLQKYGVQIDNGATDFVISDNDLTNNTTAGLIDNSTATNKRITGNLGFNGNRAAVSPTMVASTVDYTNPYGSPCYVSVFGGTVTSVKLNGTQIFASTGTGFNPIVVGPSDVLNLTYSVAPSWIWWPQ